MREAAFSLSIVAVTRNDDHGHGLFDRTRAFIENIAYQANLTKTKTELIIVEWNPPEDSVSIFSQFSQYVPKNGWVHFRVITIPRDIHDSITKNRNLKFFQMLGKNVGIRRARSKMILSTNIDVIISFSLFSAMTKVPVAPGKYYRAARHDVEFDGNVFFSKEVDYGNISFDVLRSHQNGATVGEGLDAGSSFVKSLKSFYTVYGSRSQGCSHTDLFIMVCQKMLKGLRQRRRPFSPFTNACGDFTMMHRDDWFALCGYPEFIGYSWNLDGIILQLAVSRGIEEAVFPDTYALYHLEHEDGWTPESGGRLFEQQKKFGIPYIDNVMYWKICRGIYNGIIPEIIKNSRRWGLEGCSLPIQELS